MDTSPFQAPLRIPYFQVSTNSKPNVIFIRLATSYCIVILRFLKVKISFVLPLRHVHTCRTLGYEIILTGR